MATNYVKVVTSEGLPPLNLRNAANMQSREKFKTYLHYHDVCGHQTCKGGGILRVAHIQRPRGKLGTYFQLQKTHGHQSGQGNDLL